MNIGFAILYIYIDTIDDLGLSILLSCYTIKKIVRKQGVDICQIVENDNLLTVTLMVLGLVNV